MQATTRSRPLSTRLYEPGNVILWIEFLHGQKVQVMIWLHPWKSVDRELNWKANVASSRAYYWGVDPTTLTGMEEFEGLKDAGAIECVEEHCAIRSIWD